MPARNLWPRNAARVSGGSPVPVLGPVFLETLVLPLEEGKGARPWLEDRGPEARMMLQKFGAQENLAGTRHQEPPKEGGREATPARSSAKRLRRRVWKRSPASVTLRPTPPKEDLEERSRQRGPPPNASEGGFGREVPPARPPARRLRRRAWRQEKGPNWLNQVAFLNRNLTRSVWKRKKSNMRSNM